MPFEVLPSQAEEEGNDNVSPVGAAGHALTLARRKAADVAARVKAGNGPPQAAHPGKVASDGLLVVAADTLVVLPDRVLGKPESDAEAEDMLQALSGREHTVVTAVVVTEPATGRSEGATQETRVFFRPLDREAIRAYVATGEPADKAGAYAVQGVGTLLVEKVDGDYFNVVGLPLGCLAGLLKAFDYDLLAEAAANKAGFKGTRREPSDLTQ